MIYDFTMVEENFEITFSRTLKTVSSEIQVERTWKSFFALDVSLCFNGEEISCYEFCRPVVVVDAVLLRIMYGLEIFDF